MGHGGGAHHRHFPGSAGSPSWPLLTAAGPALQKPVGRRSRLQGPGGRQRSLPAGHWVLGAGWTCVQREVSGTHPAPALGRSQGGVLGLEVARRVGAARGQGPADTVTLIAAHPPPCFPFLPPAAPVREVGIRPQSSGHPHLLLPCRAPAPLGLRVIPWAVRDSCSAAPRCDSRRGPGPLRGPWGGARLPGCRVCSPAQN